MRPVVTPANLQEFYCLENKEKISLTSKNMVQKLPRHLFCTKEIKYHDMKCRNEKLLIKGWRFKTKVFFSQTAAVKALRKINSVMLFLFL